MIRGHFNKSVMGPSLLDAIMCVKKIHQVQNFEPFLDPLVYLHKYVVGLRWRQLQFTIETTITAADRFNWKGEIIKRRLTKNTEKSSISRRRRRKEHYETRVKKSLFYDDQKQQM